MPFRSFTYLMGQTECLMGTPAASATTARSGHAPKRLISIERREDTVGMRAITRCYEKRLASVSLSSTLPSFLSMWDSGYPVVRALPRSSHFTEGRIVPPSTTLIVNDGKENG
ncbi:hypothetical protein PRIPAC_84301 [Pristionchus pacificus]|uniref:Uncharacterized protein n=1 Tax=Pristionchus pacificus TaxID=54126 RepID=A0A2A6BUK8_PRIPA|nr:hypothetical protein PRIPAC_84301 [Pristionchus pacificus]|eukprot:PDM69493.1 hypothetical protein PRIPAC_44589 [Pristionchus pacificus]